MNGVSGIGRANRGLGPRRRRLRTPFGVYRSSSLVWIATRAGSAVGRSYCPGDCANGLGVPAMLRLPVVAAVCGVFPGFPRLRCLPPGAAQLDQAGAADDQAGLEREVGTE